MNLVFKLVLFILIVSVQSGEVFKLNEKMIYDCLDIYKQPSLSHHPLLKNHKIQLEPSFSISKPKGQAKYKSEIKKIIDCPNGTIPILRNTEEYVENAQYWSEKHYNPLTINSNGGVHVAGVRTKGQGFYHGLAAFMSIHNLNVSKGQASYTNIYASKGFNNKVNFIQFGWMVNPSLFGDGRPWSYGLWKGANGGCYNTACPGFVQVSKTILLSGPADHIREGKTGVYFGITHDTVSGNWWAKLVKQDARDVPIGYWPQELFDLMGFSANMVGVTGATQDSPSSSISPPMGNGNLPTRDESKSAYVINLEIVDSRFKVRQSSEFKLLQVVDINHKCYNLKPGKFKFFKEPNLFTYGGPGGANCGR